MRRHIKLASIVATVGLLAPGAVLTLSARAQGLGGGGQGIGNFGALLRGGLNAMHDPMRSAEAALIQRDDVRHELMLDGRQQEQLDVQVKKGEQDLMEKGRAVIMEIVQKIQSGGQNPLEMTPEDRQAFMQQTQQHMQDTFASILADRDKALESVLNKKQIARLHQLDLQWRTALVLNDPKLADQVGLNPEQRPKIAALYKTYTDSQSQALRGIMGAGPTGGRGGQKADGNAQGGADKDGSQDNTNNAQGNDQGNNQDNGNGGQSAPPTRPGFDPQAMQERLQKVQKENDKVREALADKALALLTPEQKTQWNKLIGARFLFKANTPIAGDDAN